MKFKKFIAGMMISVLALTGVITPLPDNVFPASGELTITAYAATDSYIAGKESTLADLKWDGRASISINNNKPQFKKRFRTFKKVYVKAAGLDKYGRPHSIRAVLGPETVNNGYRESIDQFKPAGWQTVKNADIVDGLYIYNRCHLIGQAISAGKFSNTVNSKLNLVTGTRYMNVDGMEVYENALLEYLRNDDCHVLYQVTPVYKENDLVCRGVWMQAYSMEDKGKDIAFNVYCPNVQPGIKIDYSTGKVSVKKNAYDEMELALKYGATSVNEDGIGAAGDKTDNTVKSTDGSSYSNQSDNAKNTQEYVIATSTKKFHYPSCRYVKTIKEKNKKVGNFDRDELIKEGYVPCKVCQP